MPRAPSEKVKEAEKLFLEGMEMVAIAKKLDIPDGTIRSWKNRYSWGKEVKEKKCNVAKKKNATLQKKRGAPKGNQNAKGGKGNPSPNTTKHGGYSAVYWDTLSEDERGMIEEIPQDEETLLIEQIKLFSVRERRIMQAINKYRNTKEPVAISYVSRYESKRAFENEEDAQLYKDKQQKKVESGDRLPGKEYTITTNTENKDNVVARLESELSNIQAKKTKAIEALSRLHFEKQKIDKDSKGNDVVDDWIDAVLEGDAYEE